MIDVPDKNHARFRLLLKVTFQTQCLVSGIQHSLVNRAMWRMTNDAALAQGFMFIHKRTALRCMTLETSLIFAQKGEAASLEGLLHVGRTTFDGAADVRIVAISTAHSTLQNGMAMG